MTPPPRVLVAGIGNVFLGDDGFGVAVADALARVALPPNVSVVDYGIRGVHLALDLLDGPDVLVLVDAMPLDEDPGTVAVVEVDEAAFAIDEADPAPTMEAHAMHPAAVLRTVAGFGGRVDRVVVVGCQPETVAESMGLSPAVAAAVDRGVQAVLGVLSDIGAAARVDHMEEAAAWVEG